MYISYKRQKGFTLVELSIVIVIVGLIIAGVTAGNALVNASKIQGVVNDIGRFQTAFYAFKMQYNATPGDMQNAIDYFGASGNRNGNGNGRLECQEIYSQSGDCSEEMTFFTHLSLSGLIPEKFISGQGVNINNGFDPLYSSFPKIKSNPIHIFNVSSISNNLSNLNQVTQDNALWWPISSGIALWLKGGQDSNYARGIAPTLTTKEAYSIDTKVDDGAARKGIFMSYSEFGTNCLTGLDGDYNFSITTYACQGEYILKK